MSESSKPSKKRGTSGGKKHLVILFFVLVLLAGGYYYLRVYSQEPASVSTATESQAEYTTLENKDPQTYLSVIVYNSETDILYISKTFYGSDVFWPYIFISNKSVIDNPLLIQKDVIIKIPKLSPSQLDLENPSNIALAKAKADSILNEANKIPEPEEDFSIY